MDSSNVDIPSTDGTADLGLVPCEICEEMIPFADYPRHLHSCVTNRLFSINFAIDDRTRHFRHGHEDDTQEVAHGDVEDETADEEEIELSRNVLTGNDFRNFADELFGGFRRSFHRSSNGGGAELNVVFVRLGDGTLGITEPDEYEYNLRVAERLGKVEVGLSTEDIFNVSKTPDIIETDDICPICRDNLEIKERVSCLELVCKHKYCRDCITKWLEAHKRCPVCMIDLEEMVCKN